MARLDGKIECDHKGCTKASVGYVDRQLQGPFYCEEHKEWAEKVAQQHCKELMEVEIHERRSR